MAIPKTPRGLEGQIVRTARRTLARKLARRGPVGREIVRNIPTRTRRMRRAYRVRQRRNTVAVAFPGVRYWHLQTARNGQDFGPYLDDQLRRTIRACRPDIEAEALRLAGLFLQNQWARWLGSARQGVRRGRLDVEITIHF